MNNHKKAFAVLMLVSGIWGATSLHARLSVQERSRLQSEFDTALKVSNRNKAQEIINVLAKNGETILANQLTGRLAQMAAVPAEGGAGQGGAGQGNEIDLALLRNIHTQKIHQLDKEQLTWWIDAVLTGDKNAPEAQEFINWVFDGKGQAQAFKDATNESIRPLIGDAAKHLAKLKGEEPAAAEAPNAKEKPAEAKPEETAKAKLAVGELDRLIAQHKNLVDKQDDTGWINLYMGILRRIQNNTRYLENEFNSTLGKMLNEIANGKQTYDKLSTVEQRQLANILYTQVEKRLKELTPNAGDQYSIFLGEHKKIISGINKDNLWFNKYIQVLSQKINDEFVDIAEWKETVEAVLAQMPYAMQEWFKDLENAEKMYLYGQMQNVAHNVLMTKLD